MRQAPESPSIRGTGLPPPSFCGPKSRLLTGNTDAPLLGNGDIGVNLCGTLATRTTANGNGEKGKKPSPEAAAAAAAAGPEGLTWYIGKNDFWSTNNQDVTHNMYQSVANVATLTLVQAAAAGKQTQAASGGSAQHAQVNPLPYSMQQHLWNASITSQMGYSSSVASVASGGGGSETLSTASIVGANTNVLVVELTSTVDGEWTLSLATGSAEGAKRGLPVSAGNASNDRGSVVHIARNSTSLDNQYPRALARDCRDRMLDAFGQQSFVIDPNTRRVTIAPPAERDGCGRTGCWGSPMFDHQAHSHCAIRTAFATIT